MERTFYTLMSFTAFREMNEAPHVVVVARPGTYSTVNALDSSRNAGAEPTTVAIQKKVARRLDPVMMRCGKDGITPKKLTTHPMQGLVFSFETASRIKMELVAPDDRTRKPSSIIARDDDKDRRRKAGEGEPTIRIHPSPIDSMIRSDDISHRFLILTLDAQ